MRRPTENTDGSGVGGCARTDDKNQASRIDDDADHDSDRENPPIIEVEVDFFGIGVELGFR